MAFCFMRISIRIKEQITSLMWEKYFCLFHNNENQNLMDLYLIQFYPFTYHRWRFGKIPFSSFLWVETSQYDQMGVTSNFSQAVTKKTEHGLNWPNGSGVFLKIILDLGLAYGFAISIKWKVRTQTKDYHGMKFHGGL